MRNGKTRRYTIRSIPAALDRQLRARARDEDKSLNEVVLEALHRGAGLSGNDAVFDDLDDCVGTWQEDATFDDVLARQRRVDAKLWH